MSYVKMLWDGDKFVFETTEATIEEKPIVDKAIEASEVTAQALRVRHEARREAFLEWARANPAELDKCLYELNLYGVVPEKEYFNA